jgi:tetratricopeptide (TPR) repeat protein
VADELEPEDKLRLYDSLTVEFKSFIDKTLARKINLLSDSAVVAIFSRANDYMEKIRSEIKNEKFRLDLKRVSWIYTERGENFKYKLVIGALAYAFSSSSFWMNPLDTAKVEFLIPDTIAVDLRIFGVEDDYAILRKLCLINLKRSGSLFDEKFLVNLARNSSFLPQPYYEILSAVNNYIGENYAESKKYIAEAVRRITEDELLKRVEILRSMIWIKERGIAQDALKLYRDGMEYLSRGDKLSALDAVRRAVLIEPRFPLANYTIGELYFGEDDYYPAIIYLSKAISLDSNFVLAYKLLFEVYRKQGNWDDAKDMLESAVLAGNDCWVLRIALGQVYNELGLFDKAIESLSMAINLNPQNYDQYIYLGVVYANSGNLDEAERMLKKAAELDPDRREAYNEMRRIEEMKRAEPNKKESEKNKGEG